MSFSMTTRFSISILVENDPKKLKHLTRSSDSVLNLVMPFSGYWRNSVLQMN